MEPEFDVMLCSKKARLDLFDLKKCIFCNKAFSDSDRAVSPLLTKLDSLFTACTKRQDEVARKLLENKTQILCQEVSFSYHRDCRSTYVSPAHLSRLDSHFDESQSSFSSFDASGGDSQSFSFLRSSGQEFDWKNNCFICGKQCSIKHRSTWSMVESIIDNKSENMYIKVLHAAQTKQDKEMLTCLLGAANGDLVAVEARYHRGKNCFAKYVKSVPSNCQKNVESEAYNAAFKQLVEEFSTPIINNQVFLLTTLRDRYQELLAQHKVENTYTSQKLKCKIMKDWPQVSCIPQQGMSDLVCSSDVSVGQALLKAHDLASMVKDLTSDASDLPDDHSNNQTCNESSIIHQAIGILRRRLIQTKKLEEEYYSSCEMTLKAQQKFVDPLLYKTIGWLTSERLFEEGLDISDLDTVDPCCLSIACDLITKATGIMSPKHLGLAVSLHHQFGSRKLVEELNSLGYCVSYPELRRFLTSAAVHASNSQQHTLSGGLVPNEICPKEQGGEQPIGAGDNWDHNERTVDGKRTTHGMTSIIVSPETDLAVPYPRIPRVLAYKLDSTILPAGSLSRVLPYKKPAQRPQPSFHPPVSIEELKQSTNSVIVLSAVATEAIYHLSRSGVFHTKDNSTGVPPWGSYHAALSPDAGKKLAVSSVAYNPIIMAPPSDPATIFTTLMRNKEIINALGYQYAPIVFDMGLLTKALEITWSHSDQLSNVIPVEGGMHLLMSIIAGIGYLFGDAGLRQLLHESGVFAAGTVQQMLCGKDFDRALYGLKIVDEALTGRFLVQFKKWCDTEGKTLPPETEILLCGLDKAFEHDGSQPYQTVQDLAGTLLPELQQLIAEFRTKGRSVSPNFALWDDFLTKVLLPFKLFISATRDGSWEVYQSSKVDLLPLLFASNRTTYSRYLPVLLLMMNRLPQDVLQAFAQGLFVAKLSEGEFNSVWLDYALETTENKALKGSGGIIGLTLRGEALSRWFLARPTTAKYTQVFQQEISKQVSQNKQKSQGHHSGGKTASKRWDTDVQKMQALFSTSYMDPFDLTNPKANLINFATGVIATTEVEASLCGALTKGAEMADKFVSERLILPEGHVTTKKSFYDTLPRSNIKTMSEMHKPVRVNNRSVTMNGEVMYLRLLAVNATKQVPLTRVMSFENAPVPLSIFTEDGKMMSGNKAHFRSKLEEVLPANQKNLKQINKCDAIIFDGHAVIQVLQGPSEVESEHFHDMSAKFLDHIMRAVEDIDKDSILEVHIIFDKYNESSIKDQTRERRGACATANKHHVHLNGAVPRNWKAFLTRGENKSGLAECYTQYLSKNASVKLTNNQRMYISGGEGNKCVVIDAKDVNQVPELQSDHEEADTRIILHAKAAADNGCRSIVIQSPDTDVMVLLLHHRPSIGADEIYFLTGGTTAHVTNSRYIPIHTIFDRLTTLQHNILLPVYCLTGCDTVSFFFFHGKKTCYRIMIQHAAAYQDMATLGVRSMPSKAEYESCIKFVGALYGKKNCLSLNSLRCEKAANKIAAKKLPPTENSFHLHVMRTIYQLMIWRQATIAMQAMPEPTEYGYHKDESSHFVPTMMSQSPAAPELLNSLVCNCEPESCHDNCPCLAHDQPCTVACSCEAVVVQGDEHTGICTSHLTLTALITDTCADSDSDEDIN